MRGAFITTAGVVLTLTIAMPARHAAAQDGFGGNRGTQEQQAACTPDVFRLCGQHIPDADRITNCLRQNTVQLSTGCRAVFEANDKMPAPTAPNMRSAQYGTRAAQSYHRD